jgi:hypothetical protein
MSNPSPPPMSDERLSRAARLRVAAAFVALLAGTTALVIAVLLVRSTLA